jgi:GTP cyclohydrolase II
LIPSSNEASPQTLLLRIQSSCLFSEALNTLDCDCALQLEESMRRVAERGGVVIYLYEEGRGAGLKSKIEGIRLQQALGITSKQAYQRLGIKADGRESYEFLAPLLTQLCGPDHHWILLTNNPHKEDLMRKTALNITKTESLVCGLDSERRRAYLTEKATELGHHIML